MVICLFISLQYGTQITSCGVVSTYGLTVCRVSVFPVNIQRVPKKCIHILRDIYVKCVYIFWHPLFITLCGNMWK